MSLSDRRARQPSSCAGEARVGHEGRRVPGPTLGDLDGELLAHRSAQGLDDLEHRVPGAGADVDGDVVLQARGVLDARDPGHHRAELGRDLGDELAGLAAPCHLVRSWIGSPRDALGGHLDGAGRCGHPLDGAGRDLARRPPPQRRPRGPGGGRLGPRAARPLSRTRSPATAAQHLGLVGSSPRPGPRPRALRRGRRRGCSRGCTSRPGSGSHRRTPWADVPFSRASRTIGIRFRAAGSPSSGLAGPGDVEVPQAHARATCGRARWPPPSAHRPASWRRRGSRAPACDSMIRPSPEIPGAPGVRSGWP